jgi:hypothetical protein
VLYCWASCMELVLLKECFSIDNGSEIQPGDDVGKYCCSGRKKSDIIYLTLQEEWGKSESPVSLEQG